MFIRDSVTSAVGGNPTTTLDYSSYTGAQSVVVDQTIVNTVSNNSATGLNLKATADQIAAITPTVTTLAVNEVQTLDIAGATGGTFTLSIGAATTGAIVFDAAVAANTTVNIQTALDAFTGVGLFTVAEVTANLSWTIKFSSMGDQPSFAIDAANLTGVTNAVFDPNAATNVQGVSPNATGGIDKLDSVIAVSTMLAGSTATGSATNELLYVGATGTTPGG